MSGPADMLRTSDSRLAHERWRTWLPLGAVVVAMFALVALPILRAIQVRPLYEQMRTVTEPSRTLLTRIHVALALEQSLLRDFIEGGDSIAASRYMKAVADERSAYEELAPLVERLGPQAKTDFEQLRELERAWHSDVEKVVAGPNARRSVRDPMHAKRYEEILLTAARLDEDLNSAAANRRAAIEATNRAQVWITFAVGLLALSSAVILAWLGRRLRSFAMSEESARRKLEEAVDSRERLMRGITHDLKNPLQAISGSAELLQEEIAGPLTDGQRRVVGRIRSAGTQLLSMISDLLQLSMAEGGTLPIRPVPTTLGDVIVETASEYEQRARASGLELSVEVDSAMAPVVTDPERVKQILQNLISNAVKYTPSGGSVKISASMRQPEGAAGTQQFVAIDVADSGSGIPADKLESIFEEFSRLESHRAVPGAGLGLSIARRIAVLLGGTITVSASSAGATFTLWVPQDRRTAGALSAGVVAAAAERPELARQ